MARPTFNQIDHGQQSWDADIQANWDILNIQSTPIPQYADFAALPPANQNDRCLATTSDSGHMWLSDGTQWKPVESPVVSDQTKAATTNGALTTLKTFTFPANTLKVGDRILAEVWGSFDHATEDGELFPTFGGSTAAPSAPALAGLVGAGWRYIMDMAVTAAAAQEALVSGQVNTTLAGSRRSFTSPINAAIAFNFDAQNIAGVGPDAVTVRGFQIKVIPANK